MVAIGSGGATDITIQADDMIIVVGNREVIVPDRGPRPAMFMARYDLNGTLDPAFGNNGSITEQRIEIAVAVTLQNDGKMVVAGHIDGRSDEFVVGRFNVDGTLDDGGLEDSTPGDSFGVGGMARITFGGLDAVPSDITIQNVDGVEKIIVVGHVSGRSISTDFAVARLNPNGDLDTTFDFDGMLTIDFAGNYDSASGVTIQADGRILVAGRASQVDGSSDFGMVRFNVDGSPDLAFGSHGLVSQDFGGSTESAVKVLVQTDGKIVAFGDSNEAGNLDFLVARFTVDGNITLNTVLDGGEGNDILQGGGGKNILLGGSGFDTVILATGDNLLLDAVEQTVLSNPNIRAVTVNKGEPVQFVSSLFNNPAAAQIIWGDGTSESATINTVTGTVSGSHVYAEEGQYTVQINLTEPTDEQLTIVVNVVDVPIAPPIAQNSTLSVVENKAAGTAVGFVSSTAPDGNDLSYALTGGSGMSYFVIDSLTGEISVTAGAVLDYESLPSMTLDFEVSDELGQTATATVTIGLLNQASITGSVFVDVDGDGEFDANEPEIDGVTVELLDGNGNPVLDDANNPITAISSDGGFFLFEDLDPGTYRLHELQPTGVDDGAELLGSLGGTLVSNDTMELTLDRTDARDYVFAELGQNLTSGDSAGIGFWQNKHGQELIRQGGTELAAWLTSNFGNVFGDEFGVGVGNDGDDVANFYKEQLFKQKSKKPAGPAKVDAQFMATALATYFTSSNLAATVGMSYGFNVTATGIGTSIVNVGSNGLAFASDDGTDLTIMQLLLATNDLTDQPNGILGAATVYDLNGDGIIDAYEASLRNMANAVYSLINHS